MRPCVDYNEVKMAFVLLRERFVEPQWVSNAPSDSFNPNYDTLYVTDCYHIWCLCRAIPVRHL